MGLWRSVAVPRSGAASSPPTAGPAATAFPLCFLLGLRLLEPIRKQGATSPISAGKDVCHLLGSSLPGAHGLQLASMKVGGG